MPVGRPLLQPRWLASICFPALCVVLCWRPAVGRSRRGTHDPTHEPKVVKGVHPPLEPEDDHTFFKHDYPYDLHPHAETDFGYPFPIVQDPEDFARDYVRDDNGDGGAWKVQSEYDAIRGRLAHARDANDRAQQTRDMTEKELEATRAAHQAAKERLAAELEAKRKAEEAARERLRVAEEKYRKAMEEEDGKVAKATAVVEKEVHDLQECQKGLAAARANLKKLQEERAKAEAELAAASADAKAKEDLAVAREKHEAALEQEVTKEEHLHAAAKAEHAREQKELDKVMEEFSRAEAKLRHFRESPSSVPGKSSAMPRHLPWMATTLLLALCSGHAMAPAAD